jgi:hypothetical protein
LSLYASAPPGTANPFKMGLALSTANLYSAVLYSAVQPGGSLSGLQHGNPVDTTAAYLEGNAIPFGTAQDPMVGARIVGGVGVSGDTSCIDHNVGWRIRNALGLHKFGAVGADGGMAGDANSTRAPQH